MLAPGHTSPPTTKDKEMYGTKNNCMHVQLGQILDKKIQRDFKKKPKQPNCQFRRTWGAKAEGWEQKRSYEGPLHTRPPQQWASHLSHPSSMTPGHPYPHPI